MYRSNEKRKKRSHMIGTDKTVSEKITKVVKISFACCGSENFQGFRRERWNRDLQGIVPIIIRHSDIT
jgi:hypothetical protein